MLLREGRADDAKRQQGVKGIGAEHIEIERKFLIKSPPDLTGLMGEEIRPGYIKPAADGNPIRVRQKGSRYFQAIKGDGGLKRREREVEISKEQFDSLWPRAAGRRLKKARYEIPYEGFTIELDVYGGGLEGLVVAEVEFRTEQDSVKFTTPSWFGQEVTHDRAFRNKNLAKRGLPSKAQLNRA
jgi:CYTH domain-containing protein